MSNSTWRDLPEWPDVDVVMPIRNEAAHLDNAIASVRSQTYPGTLRIILGVGPSTDGTETLAADLAAACDDLTVVDNPSGNTPSGLNLAIRAGSAPVVVRVDGHSELSAGYIRRAVDVLRETGAANVGGVQRPEPTTPFEQSVADATTSLLGTGGASYRVGEEARSTDTVYLGVFDRAAIEAVGLFDEHLIRNQDYELNIRLRGAGGIVWFDPTLSVGYRPRGSWSALATQYFEYGQWKAEVLRLHPDSLKLRQFVAPAGVLGVAAATIAGFRRPVLWLVPAAYAAALGWIGTPGSRWRTAGVLATIHGAWTAGLLRGPKRRSDDREAPEAAELTQR